MSVKRNPHVHTHTHTHTHTDLSLTTNISHLHCARHNVTLVANVHKANIVVGGVWDGLDTLRTRLGRGNVLYARRREVFEVVVFVADVHGGQVGRQ